MGIDIHITNKGDTELAYFSKSYYKHFKPFIGSYESVPTKYRAKYRLTRDNLLDLTHTDDTLFNQSITSLTPKLKSKEQRFLEIS